MILIRFFNCRSSCDMYSEVRHHIFFTSINDIIDIILS
jgi:hypothetical protein